MTTESNMVGVGPAGSRLKSLGFRLETTYDGAKRQWLSYSKPGKRGKMRVYSGRVFANELEEAEGVRQ